MRILRSPLPYLLIAVTFLFPIMPVIPLAYFIVGILTANIVKYFRLREWNKEMVVYNANKALSNPDKSIGKPDRPSGGEYLLEYIALALFWLPMTIMIGLSSLKKYTKARQGKTAWNYSNGTWDYPNWEDSPTNQNRRF